MTSPSPQRSPSWEDHVVCSNTALTLAQLPHSDRLQVEQSLYHHLREVLEHLHNSCFTFPEEPFRDERGFTDLLCNTTAAQLHEVTDAAQYK